MERRWGGDLHSSLKAGSEIKELRMSDRSDGKTKAQRCEALPQGRTADWELGKAASSDYISGLGIFTAPRSPSCRPMPHSVEGQFGEKRKPHVAPQNLMESLSSVVSLTASI